VIKPPIFEGADEDRIRPILSLILPRTIEKGQMLAGPGIGPVRVHLLLEGELQSFELNADGRRLIVEIIEPGGLDGLLLAAGFRGHFTQALQRSEVISIPGPTLKELIGVEPRIAVNLIRLILARLEKREDQIDSLAYRTASRRLARQLIALGQYVGRAEARRIVLRPRLTHQLLADMLGVRRATVTVHLNILIAVGAVSERGDRFVLDLRLLQQIVDGKEVKQRGRRRDQDP